MLTVDDIRKLTEVFATKEDLKDLVTKMEMEGLERRLNNTLDKLYKELLAIREEQSVHRQEHDDTNERLDRIESVPVIAHELKLK